MTARKRHLARPGDLTGPEHAVDVLCGLKPRRSGDSLWATEEETKVTCDNCLKVMIDIEREAVNAKLEAAGLSTAGTGDWSEEDADGYIAAKLAEFAEEAEASIIEEDTVPMAELKSLYTTDAYLVPTGPLVERPDYVVPGSYDDRAIAGRHGLQRFEVENAINDGWLKR